MTQCLNCGRPVSDRFCGHCGQSVEVGRISAAYVLAEVFEFATNIRDRFFATAWRLLAMPGTVAGEFIEGKRKTYQSPVSYFLIWTAIYILTLSLIETRSGPVRPIDYGDYFGPGQTTSYAISHLGLVLAVIVPFHALFLRLLITGKSFAYFEAVAAAIYMIGTIILLQTAFVLVGWLAHLAAGVTVSLAVSDVLKVAYLTWFAADLSRRFSRNLRPLRVALFVLLAIGVFSLWRLYGVPSLLRAASLAAA